MRTTSALYKALLNDPDGLMEVKIVVNNDADHPIYLDNISRLNTRSNVFGEGSSFSVGNAVSAIADVVLTDIESTQIPRAAELAVSYRLSNGTDASEWLPAGTLLVDHRTDDPIGNELTLECFDDMMKAEAEWVPAGMEEADWPMNEADALQNIANQMGVAIDPRTAPMLTGYSVPLPSTGQTMRDTLRYIAASHMANAIITPERKLRLVPLVPEFAGETINADNVSNLDTSSPFAPVTGVTLVVDESATEGFVAGDDSGYMLTAICPWATQEIAEACLQQVRGYVYKPMTLTDTSADPALELGDEMTSEDIEWPLCSMDFDFGKIWYADLSAPADQEVDHEYPYKSSAERKISAIKKLATDASVKVDKQAGEIELCVKKNGVISSINASEEGVKIAAALIQLLGDVSVGEDGKVRISDGAVTAEKLRVDSLESIVAKIGGFNISSDGLENEYIEIKNSEEGAYVKVKPADPGDWDYSSRYAQDGLSTYCDDIELAGLNVKGSGRDICGMLSLSTLSNRPGGTYSIDLDPDNGLLAYHGDHRLEITYDRCLGINQVGEDIYLNGFPYLDKVYPVGSIYMSVNDTNPGTLFGGTWSQIKDKFLLACGSTYANGATGGEATHKLTAAESGVPAHGHGNNFSLSNNANTLHSATAISGVQSDTVKQSTSATYKYLRVVNEGASLTRNSVTLSGDVSNNTAAAAANAHNNMPPYLAVYVWKRTA